MPRKKRNPPILEKAQNRLSGMQAIDAMLDLGPTLSAPQYSQHINDLRDLVNRYNTLLSNVDQLQSEIDVGERFLADYTEHMLAGVVTKYGKDSPEYEKAGGVRKSKRKRPIRQVAFLQVVAEG